MQLLFRVFDASYVTKKSTRVMHALCVDQELL